MKLNQFLHLMNSIEEVMENDDVYPGHAAQVCSGKKWY